MLITRLLLILEVYSMKPTHTKSWARNFLMLDLTLGPSFKVKQWFTGFGELSFRWIQICIGLRCVGLVFISSCKGCNFLKLHSQLIHTIKAGKIHSYFVVIIQNYDMHQIVLVVKNWVQIFTNLFRYSSLIMTHLYILIFSSLSLLTSILLQ